MKSRFQYSFCLFCLHLTLLSQIPEGYYDLAKGLTGQELKSALNDIIKGHFEFPYTSSSIDVWDILKESDMDPVNPDNVILFYTGWSVYAAQEYNNGSGWTREHVWAKSRGDFGTTQGPGTDVHHIRPSDISVNATRNNRWFDTDLTSYLDGVLEMASFASNTRWVWKPREEVRGDVARMIFYMATRYEGESGEPDLEVIDYLPSDNNTKDPVHAKLSTLLSWHQEDPVDFSEQYRNEIIYSYQFNRNPFIDHPEYVTKIWKSHQNEMQISSEVSQFRIYTDPTTRTLIIESKDCCEYSIHISTLNGKLLFLTQGILKPRFQIDLTSFHKGIYLLSIRSKDVVSTIKIIL